MYESEEDREQHILLRAKRLPRGRIVSAFERFEQAANKDSPYKWCCHWACEICKQPISKARLEAVPWTRLCRECKEQKGT